MVRFASDEAPVTGAGTGRLKWTPDGGVGAAAATDGTQGAGCGHDGGLETDGTGRVVDEGNEGWLEGASGCDNEGNEGWLEGASGCDNEGNEGWLEGASGCDNEGNEGWLEDASGCDNEGNEGWLEDASGCDNEGPLGERPECTSSPGALHG